MIGTLDKEIIEKFKEFKEKTGKHNELYIEDVEFEKVYLNNKNYFEINPKKSEIEEELFQNNIDVSFVPLASINSLEGKIDKLETRKILDVKNGYTYFKENDVIFTKVTPSMENGNFAIASNLINGIGFGSSEYYIFRCKNIHTKLLWFLFRADFFRNRAQKTMKGAGGLKRVPLEFFNTQYIPIPKDLNKFYTSFQIQEAIVEFLEFWKDGYTDVIRDKVSKKKPIYEAIRRIVVQNTFKYDKFLVEKFEIFAKDRNYNLKLYEIMFDRVHITKYINMSRGKVISKKDLVQNGKYPVFSSQTKNNGLFGYIDDYMFDGDAITWTTDGKHAGTTFLRSGKFNYTNVCGLITVKDNNVLNIIYLSYMVNKIFPKYVDRTSKNSKLMTHHIEDIEIFLPTHKSYTSKEIQLLLVNFWEMIIKQIDDNLAIYQRMIELTDIIDRAFLYRTFSKIDWSKE